MQKKKKKVYKLSNSFLIEKFLGYDQYDHETEAADDNSTSVADGNGDVQKKIMPWKQMVPDEETTQEMEYGVKERHEDGLVVVTSLISKVPNLGGKCNILTLYNTLILQF